MDHELLEGRRELGDTFDAFVAEDFFVIEFDDGEFAVFLASS